ncbi:MAG: FHA domain-containing protein [Pseudomonadota bacterium]
MAKVILSLEGSVIREIPLDKDRVTIGRKAQNDIPIENLAVSGEHACIVTILNDSFLEDLGSTNGTLVNGNPIKKHILQNNDVIEIGKYKLKYMVEASTAPATEAPAEDMEKTMVLRPSAALRAPPPRPSGDAREPQASIAAPAPLVQAAPLAASEAAKPAEAPLRPTIQILNGASAGRELELTKNLTTLGKPGVQVAVITRRPQGYFIAHVEGASFPVVNGKTLDAQAHPLNDHDMVELAGVKMEFFFKTNQP